MRWVGCIALVFCLAACCGGYRGREPGVNDTATSSASVAGTWIYRSFRPHLPLNTPFNELKFGEGLIVFGRVENDGILESSLDMGGGYFLNITGRVIRDNGSCVTGVEWRGVGVEGTPTAGWIYDYKAAFAPQFPEQTNRTQILLGQTVRTVAHGPGPAGVTGPFFMVRQP